MRISTGKLDLALARHCMSLAELSEASGISRVRLTDIRAGRAEVVRPATIGKIANGLGVPVTEIIETEE